MSKPGDFNRLFHAAFSPGIVRRSVKVSLIVGTILMFINHGDALFTGNVDLSRGIKIILTYCVPYLVSTYSGATALIDQEKARK